MRMGDQIRHCGISASSEELEFIRETIKDCFGLSRTELAHTICELLDWRRPNGRLKAHECRIFLEELDSRGILLLPGLHPSAGPKKPRALKIEASEGETIAVTHQGRVKDFGPVWLEKVEKKEDRDLWREWVGRFHYLGYKVPFGAHLRYFVRISRPEPTRVGCVQLTSPAWRMAPRDQWIGWDEPQKERRLQWIVQNSRFLILPSVRIANLASTALSLMARQTPQDWQELYAIRPVLMETLVDPSRFRGTCYLAANWLHLGITTGRGRMDKDRLRIGLSPKEIYVYPLIRDARKKLLEA
jgi:hypothetical protein